MNGLLSLAISLTKSSSLCSSERPIHLWSVPFDGVINFVVFSLTESNIVPGKCDIYQMPKDVRTLFSDGIWVVCSKLALILQSHNISIQRALLVFFFCTSNVNLKWWEKKAGFPTLVSCAKKKDIYFIRISNSF